MIRSFWVIWVPFLYFSFSSRSQISRSSKELWPLFILLMIRSSLVSPWLSISILQMSTLWEEFSFQVYLIKKKDFYSRPPATTTSGKVTWDAKKTRCEPCYGSWWQPMLRDPEAENKHWEVVMNKKHYFCTCELCNFWIYHPKSIRLYKTSHGKWKMLGAYFLPKNPRFFCCKLKIVLWEALYLEE